MKAKKSNNIEYLKRIRVVQEWILENYPYCDILSNIQKQWGVSDRQAKYYIAKARELWSVDDQASIREKKKIKIQKLQREIRNMKPEYRGTPKGINAVLAVYKEIARLENLVPSGKGPVVQQRNEIVNNVTSSAQATSNVDYTKLPDEILKAIVDARIKDNV